MRSLSRFSALALALALVACGAPVSEDAPEPVEVAEAPSGIIDIKAEEFAFTAPPTFPSGWVKLNFDNEGEETHFVYILELPEGATFDEYASDVSGQFSALYAKFRAGELDQAAFFEQLGAAVPEWIFTARRVGGPGFTAPGQSSTTTIYLDPGDYVIECYVRAKDADDTFHAEHGMLRPLIVTEEPSSLAPPEADIEIALSSYELVVEGDLTAGAHVARVRVEDNPEGLVFHNVHLVRLDGDVTGETVASWMNWVDELLPPAPAEFLGGAGQASEGSVSYFEFTLEPGRYAWVSEMHGLQGMVHEFIVE
jgi:hypothetical protein